MPPVVRPIRPASLRLPVLLLALSSAVLTVAAGMMLCSAFMFYDDEGYVLITLRNFSEHGRLYRDVYSQYGPFPYVAYWFLHLAGMPLAHNAMQLLTVAAWSGIATLAAWTVWKATRHSACMLATLSGVFVYLWIMISEPGHPGGLIALVTAIMGLGGYLLLTAGRWRAWAILAGAGCAILLLTKINVGAFALISSVVLLLLHSRHDGLRRAAPWLVALGLLALPFGLMWPLLGTEWVETYAHLFAFAAVPTAFTLALQTAPAAGVREWRTALIAGTVIFAVVLSVVFLRGTTPVDLLQGVLLGPLRHPGHFNLRFSWPPGVEPAAAGSLALFILAYAARHRGRPEVDTTVAVLRFTMGIALAFAVWQFPGTSPDHAVFGFSLASLWLFLWPLPGEAPALVTARGWLGLLFLGQWLHAFPVSGSQIAWGTELALPLGAIGAWQAGTWLIARHGERVARGWRQGIDLLLTLGLAAGAVFTGNSLVQIGSRYLDSRPLDLPGGEILHLPDNTTALYRLLVFNAEVHGDMLFSLPGMFSLNAWSRLPTPTLANVTHWFSLLDEDQQQAIIRSLRQHPRACVIIQTEHVKFLQSRGLNPSGPLYDYVMKEFVTAFRLDDFEFRVHRGRQVAPFLTGELFAQQSGGGPNTLVRLNLLLPAGQTVGRVDVMQMDDHVHSPLVLDAKTARVEVTPIDLEGKPLAAPAARTFPLSLAGRPAQLALYFNRDRQPLSVKRTMLVVRDPAGAELALVRLLP